jgi:hypothetical protein
MDQMLAWIEVGRLDDIPRQGARVVETPYRGINLPISLLNVAQESFTTRHTPHQAIYPCFGLANYSRDPT